MLNAKQLRAAARHARELAMECVNGTAPEFGGGIFMEDGKPYCPCGHVAWRAGIRSLAEMESLFWTLLPGPAWAVVTANDNDRRGVKSRETRQASLPFPLLWLADELENAANGRPQP